VFLGRRGGRPQLIRKRYAIFKQHYNAMFGLKDRFQFHLIDASGSIEQVRNVILHEFEYQSSLELDQDTHDMLQALPLATDVGKHARQDLVRRLDGYMFNHRDLFQCVSARLAAMKKTRRR